MRPPGSRKGTGIIRTTAAVAVALAVGVVVDPGSAQQVADTAFVPDVGPPAYPRDAGPVVVVDGAHNNFHTVDGRYAPFAWLLRRDGFRVRGSSEPFTAGALADVDVLVVANALHDRNIEDWSLPTPSAFDASEIRAVREWVERGGALLLVADHMPFPGAAEELAAAFGFRFRNGFAADTTAGGPQNPLVFRRAGSPTRGGGTLVDHPVTRGESAAARVDSVATFVGQAFLGPTDAEPLLVFGPGAIQLLPEEAWRFGDGTPSEPVDGWLQGALRRVGRGRVAVFGEAAQFSAQRAGPEGDVRMGMNAPGAPDNAQFALNVLHWLAGEPAP